MVRRKTVAVAALLVVTLLVPCVCAAEKSTLVWNKDIDAAKQAVEQGRPVLLYLTMPGCSYCQRMKSETFSRKSIAQQISTQYVPVELTGTANPELARKLKVRVYPTTVLISPRGEVVDIMHGFKSPAAFTKQLAAANSKIMASRAASRSAAPIR